MAARRKRHVLRCWPIRGKWSRINSGLDPEILPIRSGECAHRRLPTTERDRTAASGSRLTLPHVEQVQSALSFTRTMMGTPCRLPFGRPAIPIDMTAFWYHWSVLKTARLAFSFAGRARESDFLALVDLEVTFFGIIPPASLVPLSTS